MQSRLRIIGGKWRRREIRFDSRPDVRPTTDSARETLFNWLQTRIQGARCLDLFAGSGALGFEALSRGAAHVVFIDKDKRCIQQLERTAAELNADSFEMKHLDAAKYIEQTDQQFDIVFLDPPFHRGLAERSVKLLSSSQHLAPDALIYVETENSSSLDTKFPGWTEYRRLNAGSRVHKLLEADSGSEFKTNTNKISDDNAQRVGIESDGVSG